MKSEATRIREGLAYCNRKIRNLEDSILEGQLLDALELLNRQVYERYRRKVLDVSGDYARGILIREKDKVMKALVSVRSYLGV